MTHKEPPERPQLTSLLAEANPADTDFIHGGAIEFQLDDAEFGGIEWPGIVSSAKGGKRRANGLKNRFPILVVSLVIENLQFRKLFLERRRDGDELAHEGAGCHAVGGDQFDAEIRRFAFLLFRFFLLLGFLFFLFLFVVLLLSR